MAVSMVQRKPRIRLWHGGLAVLALGVCLTLAGAYEARRSDSFFSCASGTAQIAKFDNAGGAYQFDGPADNGGVVTITNGTDAGGTWTSSMPVTEIIVKSNQSEAVHLSPQTSGLFGDAAFPRDVGRGPSEISYVRFCGGSISKRTDIAVPLILAGATLVAAGLAVTVMGRARDRRSEPLPIAT